MKRVSMQDGRILIPGLLLICLIFSSGTQAGSYNFTAVGIQGASSVSPSGVNNLGDIVGTYWDVSGVTHGFLLHSGSITTLDYPGAIYTEAFGINSAGDIVGHYGIGTGYEAFLYRTGTFSTITVPGAGTAVTQAYGINDQGDIVGFFSYPNDSIAHGFLFHEGGFSTLDLPFPTIVMGASGISNNDSIVGSFQKSSGAIYSAFHYSAGNYTTFSVPGARQTHFYGINSDGDMVGVYQDISYINHAFVYHAGGIAPFVGPGG